MRGAAGQGRRRQRSTGSIFEPGRAVTGLGRVFIGRQGVGELVGK